MADLPFRDDSAQPNSQLPPATEPWEKLVRRIKGMLVGDEYEYASDTLRGILDTVQKTRRVTNGQERAVLNIEENPHRYRQRGGRW